MNIKRFFGFVLLAAVLVTLIVICYPCVRGRNSVRESDVHGQQPEVSSSAAKPVYLMYVPEDNLSYPALAVRVGKIIHVGKRTESCGLEVVLLMDGIQEGPQKAQYCNLAVVKVGVGERVQQGDTVGRWPVGRSSHREFSYID